MIRAVVFDWGGVIQRTMDCGPRRALDSELGLPSGSVERAVFHSAEWEQASRGKCSADEAWAAIVASLGYPPDRIREFIERFFAGDRLDREFLWIIRVLRRQGLRVGLLSNAPPGRTSDDSSVGRWGLDGLFDAQVFSYQVGVLKPDPRMYGTILAALAVPPGGDLTADELTAGETLFIDDSPVNVQGALDVGMDALRFVSVGALRRDLARRGIPLSGHEEG